jgi:hypothetical protein
MSIKSKAAAAAMTLSLAGGIGAVLMASPGSASAATPSCGSQCVDLFSKQFGSHTSPNFVVDSEGQGDKAGTPVILFRQSNSNQGEDFTVDNQGLVSEFYAAGLVSPAVALHYGCTDAVFTYCTNNGGVGVNDYAYEYMYSPYGAQSGLCIGVATTAAPGTKVSLQPCGLSGKTVWIRDNLDESTATDPNGDWPLINGSDTDFSEPYVLTYPGSSYPTDQPRPELYTTNLTGFSQGANAGTPGGDDDVSSNQLWSWNYGVLP